MTLYYGFNAPHTGLCLIDLSISSLGAIANVAICQGGSHEFVGYLNPSDVAESGVCNWLYKDAYGLTEAICLEIPLTGTIGHDGDSYSIYDATSTLPLIYTTISFSLPGSPFTEAPALLVNVLSSEYEYFYTNVGYGTQSLTPVSGTTLPTGPLSSLPVPTMSSSPVASLNPSASSTSSMATATFTPPVITTTTTSSTRSSVMTGNSPQTTLSMPTSPGTSTIIHTRAASSSSSLNWPSDSTSIFCGLALVWLCKMLL